MKKSILVLYLFFIINSLCSCYTLETNITSNNLHNIFKKFISGEQTAVDNQDNNIMISKYTFDKTSKYTFFDINKDGKEELLIKSNESLDIFTLKDNSLYLVIELPTYYMPLNNGAFLYVRDGAAPEHTDYIYTILNTDGEKLFEQSFSEYKISDTEIKYFLNNIETSKEIFDSVSKPIFKIDNDKIKWQNLK